MLDKALVELINHTTFEIATERNSFNSLQTAIVEFFLFQTPTFLERSISLLFPYYCYSAC